MTINPLYSIEQLPTTSAAAIREFEDRYIGYCGASQPEGWADTLGDLFPTDAPMVTFPVSQLRTKYQKTMGDDRAKTLQEKSFDVKVEEFDDGYEASLLDLTKKVFAYRNWTQAAQRFVLAEEQHRHDNIATLLEAGASTLCVDGQYFFDTDHPANLSDSSAGSWSNYQSSTADVTDLSKIEAEATAMMGVLDENGKKLGVMPDAIGVPTEKFEALKNKLASALILDSTGTAAVSNPYFGRFKVVHMKELTDPNDWYLFDTKLISRGLAPWISMRMNVPPALALRNLDESSDFFKKTGKIKMLSHIWYGFSLALPHAIRLIKGA
jgi:hypothetical protein